MIVFSSSGIDIFLKQIIKDVLLSIIENDDGAQNMFATFVERRLKKSSDDNILKVNQGNELSLDIKLIANAISSNNSRVFLLDEYTKSLTDSSLQSIDQIFKVSAAFAIKTEDILSDIGDKALKDVFHNRNNVIHEFDIDFSKSTDSNTKKRKKKETIDQCEIMLKVMFNFLEQLNIKMSDINK